MTPTPSPFSYLIAVSGGSGSGKSTLAAALVASLTPARAVIFKEDAYYWPLSYYGDPVDAAARAELTAKIDYDHPASKDTELIADHLGALKRGQAIDQPIYDYETHDRLPGQTYRIEPRKIIILEGIHALSASAILPLIDLSVYVDTPDDLRLARRIQRDVIERERDVRSVVTQYLRTVRAAHYRHTHPAKFSADLVIADEGLPAYGDVAPGDEAIGRMVSPVLNRLRLRGVIS